MSTIGGSRSRLSPRTLARHWLARSQSENSTHSAFTTTCLGPDLEEADADGEHVDGQREAVDPHVPEAAVAHLAATLQFTGNRSITETHMY